MYYYYKVMFEAVVKNLPPGYLFFFFKSFSRLLRDNPLICSCDLHWLQQWELTDRGDVNSQILSCSSGDQDVPLSALVLDNCSELLPHILVQRLSSQGRR